VGRRAECAFLHIAVARGWQPASGQGDLNEAGAIKSERGLAAPQVGRAGKSPGNSNKIALVVADRFKMRRWHVTARWRDRQAIFNASNGERGAKRQRFERRQSDRWPRENKRAPRRKFKGPARAGAGQGPGREPGGLGGRGKAGPGPGLGMRGVNHDALALERLGIERRVGPRLTAKRRLRRNDLHNAAL